MIRGTFSGSFLVSHVLLKTISFCATKTRVLRNDAFYESFNLLKDSVERF